jgi:hypothetical protein
VSHCRFFWFGRVLLWIFLFPVGVWRSLRHHRKKGVREAKRETEKLLKKRT